MILQDESDEFFASVARDWQEFQSEIRRYNVKTGKQQMMVRCEATQSIALSGDCNLLAIPGRNAITILDAQTSEQVFSFSTPSPLFVQFTDNDRLLIYSDRNGKMKLLHLPTKQQSLNVTEKLIGSFRPFEFSQLHACYVETASETGCTISVSSWDEEHDSTIMILGDGGTYFNRFDEMNAPELGPWSNEVFAAQRHIVDAGEAKVLQWSGVPPTLRRTEAGLEITCPAGCFDAIVGFPIPEDFQDQKNVIAGGFGVSVLVGKTELVTAIRLEGEPEMLADSTSPMLYEGHTEPGWTETDGRASNGAGVFGLRLREDSRVLVRKLGILTLD